MESVFIDKRHWTASDVAELMVSHTALTHISFDDAKAIVTRMKPRRVPIGTVLFRENEKDADSMLFILQGEAVVENSAGGHGEAVVLTVVKAGDIIGEQGVMDNQVRSATVTAATDMMVAVLDQASFAAMIKEEPAVACSLLGSMFKSMSQRLREAGRRLHTLTQINKSLHQELLDMQIAAAQAEQRQPPAR